MHLDPDFECLTYGDQGIVAVLAWSTWIRATYSFSMAVFAPSIVASID